MERGTVKGVHRAVARPEGEHGRGLEDQPGFRVQARVLGGRHGSRRPGGEGTLEQQTPLGAHQEGVGVPGGQSQGGDAHVAAASGLRREVGHSRWGL